MTGESGGDRTFEDMSGPFSLRESLTIVFKRRKMIVFVAAAVLAVAVVVSLLMQPVYVVTATLLVNKARAEVPIAPTESSQTVMNVSEQDLNSEVEMLKSRKLVEEVLGDLDSEVPALEEKAGMLTGMRSLGSSLRSALRKPEMSSFDRLVLSVVRNLEITTVRRSNVIRVSYRSSEPEWATLFVRTLTERYIEQRVERYQSSQVVSFFEEQMREAGQRLNERETALKKMSGEAQVTITKGPQGSDPLADQKAVVLNRLAELQNELGNADTDVQEQSRKIANLTERLAGEPERLASPNRNLSDVSAETIKQQLTTLELERDALLQDFKHDSRYVRDIETQIALAEERLEELQRNIGAIDGTEVNPIHQSLKGELLRAEADLEGTRARFESLKNQVTDYKSELETLNQESFEFDSLRREAQAAEEEYLLYRKKFEEARISAAMDQQRLINVTIAQPAQRPIQPEGRGTRSILLLAIGVGILGGIGFAFATELYLDHSFTTGHEMERRLGIPHIASIPEGS
jgi:uncharacterized protein involved in exopolysaccharide biosynthesis